MSGGTPFNVEFIPPGCTPYDYGDLTPPFTRENTRAVDSIRNFLSEDELIQARKLEIVYYSPIHQTVGGVVIPGIRTYNTSFCLYLKKYEEILTHDLLEKFIDAVCEGHPDLNPDTIHRDWFRVTVPNGDRYYPLQFHGDLDAWIDRMIAVATEKGTTMGWFDKGKFCLNDGSRMAFGDLKMVRLMGGEAYPDDW